MRFGATEKSLFGVEIFGKQVYNGNMIIKEMFGLKSKKILQRSVASIVTAMTLVTVVFALSVSANEEIMYTDILKQYEYNYVGDESCIIPVAIDSTNSPISIIINDSNGNYLGYADKDCYVAPGHQIICYLYYSTIKNHRLLFNGEEAPVIDASV